MQTSTNDYSAVRSTDRRLEELIRVLAEEGRAARAEAHRERRRARVMIGVLTVLLIAAGWSAFSSRNLAQAEMPAHGRSAAFGADERAARRAELLAMLPAEKRRELERFEQEVDWLSGYMGTWDDDDAGAVVAMMLFRMAQSMDTMPSMEQQMRTMSGQMGALPAIVAELNQINAKMHVITGTMDSTMGRAGRMMPWMPFSP